MNSYFKRNRDYREQYIEETALNMKVRSSKYPDNINFKDFFMYLLHPTFAYQDEYPIKHEFKLGTFLSRVTILFISLVSTY